MIDDRYPDRPETASNGDAFAELCVRLHRDLMSEDVGYHRSALDQLTRGECAAGIEFKHLQQSKTRLHIEVAERTSRSGKWFASGIYADERMTRYCCGNDDDIWTFKTADLRERASWSTNWYEHPTIRSMVLFKSDAMAFFIYRFRRQGSGYILMRR